ncbi:peptidylprolyl isomerase [Actinophytocola sp.]|uniref:peptidylprolyl isomerase n=1 Tax=Actinophytocola sp. TaxID=1872138 RepID=UPI003899B031
MIRTAAVIAAVALTLAGCVAKENASDQRGGSDFSPASTEPSSDSAEPSAEPSASGGGAATSGDCKFKADQSGKQPAVGLPPDEGPATATTLTLTTSAGAIAIKLDAAKAPCTVQSMVFLASKGFFNNTVCHRLTTSAALKVLQCGDPEGTGTGGPGYVVPDELPKDLPAAPAGNGTVIYQRGVAAMANAGPGTTGSQFFLVYGDSTLTPDYNVFGTIDTTGLATLDQIAAGGVTPGQNGAEDGAPTTPVTITSATAA